MKFFKHIINQPFIFATGLAALIHSTWSLGTLFAGHAPETFSPAWWAWLIPALLIAFAMDVGQISTSAQIREHGMTFWRMLTFAVFAIATWYLQWLYIAHHMPELALAPGIGEVHRAAALWLRDMAMWIIPALLPLSTLLYTFSSDREQQQIDTIEVQPVSIREVAPKMPELSDGELPDSELQIEYELPETPLLVFEQIEQELVDDVAQVDKSPIRLLADGKRQAQCPDCDWLSEPKDTDLMATRALSAHKSHCTAKHVHFSQNGVTDVHAD